MYIFLFKGVKANTISLAYLAHHTKAKNLGMF